MFLNANQIEEKHRESLLTIEPFNAALLKPASYVLRLGDKVRRWKQNANPIDLLSADCSNHALGPVEPIEDLCICQGDFFLVNSYEKIGMANSLIGFVMTLSHLSRVGVSVTADSHLVSPGFGKNSSCELTLEITSHNPTPVRLQAGLPICHLLISTLDESNSPKELSRSVYENRTVPSGPSLYEEFAGNPALASSLNHHDMRTTK